MASIHMFSFPFRVLLCVFEALYLSTLFARRSGRIYGKKIRIVKMTHPPATYVRVSLRFCVRVCWRLGDVSRHRDAKLSLSRRAYSVVYHTLSITALMSATS